MSTVTTVVNEQVKMEGVRVKRKMSRHVYGEVNCEGCGVIFEKISPKQTFHTVQCWLEHRPDKQPKRDSYPIVECDYPTCKVSFQKKRADHRYCKASHRSKHRLELQDIATQKELATLRYENGKLKEELKRLKRKKL